MCRLTVVSCVSCRFALTKLDILDDQPIIKIGVAYVVNGQKIDYYPSMSTVTSASAARLRIKQQQEMFSNFKTMKLRVQLRHPLTLIFTLVHSLPYLYSFLLLPFSFSYSFCGRVVYVAEVLVVIHYLFVEVARIL